ncbi:hypothetical protein ACFL08_01435 [Patescibacteria group bacterium]
MRTKLLAIIYIAILGVIVYWGYPVIKDRYFTPSTEGEEVKESFLEKFQKQDSEDESFDEDEDSSDEDIEKVEYLEITNQDCDGECKDFEETTDIEYCKQVCGLAPTTQPETLLEPEAKEVCDDLDKLKRDYCLKDTAVKKMDFSLCEKIEDKKIKETCQNRITEDILNGDGH